MKPYDNFDEWFPLVPKVDCPSGSELKEVALYVMNHGYL